MRSMHHQRHPIVTSILERSATLEVSATHSLLLSCGVCVSIPCQLRGSGGASELMTRLDELRAARDQVPYILVDRAPVLEVSLEGLTPALGHHAFARRGTTSAEFLSISASSQADHASSAWRRSSRYSALL